MRGLQVLVRYATMELSKNVDVLDELERELAESERSDEQKALENVDLVRVMQTPEGERVLRRILAFSRLFKVSYVRGDSHETAYCEGRRQVGLWLLSIMGEADAALCSRVMNGACHGRPADTDTADAAGSADR